VKRETDVLVVGGGPAGLLAAIGAARGGARVVLLEKNTMLGRKLRITGKGRCNITNTGDIPAFIRQFGEQGAFLYSAFSRFFSQDICRLLEEEGVAVKTERGGRIFPASDRAADVAAALERAAVRAGVEIRRGCRVQGLMLAGETGAGESGARGPGAGKLAPQEAGVGKSQKGPGCRVIGVRLEEDGSCLEIRARAVILATGGKSYPLTGSTGEGYGWARGVGHTIVETRPALAPLESSVQWLKGLSGLALKNINASLWAADSGAAGAKPRLLAAFQGEMLFAHFGLTGPVILSLSRYYRKEMAGSAKVLIDLKPALRHEVLDKRLQRDFLKHGKKLLSNAMTDLLPKALIPAVLREAGLALELPVAELTKEGRQRLGKVLKALPVAITGTRPIAEAIVTAGGVALPEVQPKTMASRKAAGLYFAGEILDIDGFTGGYNLQAAFSTGWTAGESAASSSPGRGPGKSKRNQPGRRIRDGKPGDKDEMEENSMKNEMEKNSMKNEQVPKERRGGTGRRSGSERRDANERRQDGGEWHGTEERRSGKKRRNSGERRSGNERRR
jgi:predicted flavoprotein YhiN